ncbi:MAG: putative Biopolymer transport exbB protein [Verrucomicrobiaceae bacterium]|nr:putative Biopolymer transport exbB protein [Verrucomicrobiaceae bacterium]
MTIKRLTPFVLQLAMVFAGLQLMSAPVSAQEQPAADTAAPADQTAAPVDQSAAPVDQATSAASSANEATTEKNPYGLGALWSQGDAVAKGTLVLMAIMSAVTWYTLFTKLWEQQRLFNQAKEARKLWEANSIAEGVQKLSKNSAYRGLAEDGLKAVKHHDGRLTDKIDIQDWITMTIQRGVESVNSALQGGMSFLATTGSCAPFVGLFGTVWGIYHALIAIGVAGQASIDKVAGPVGEALIMTAIGLAVAVPAVLGYNWLVRRNKVAMEQIRQFGEDVHATLSLGARIDQGDTLSQRSK